MMHQRALYDLHSHTTASDGKLRPRELVRLAEREGLRALAITDHDTVDALDEATEEARSVGLELVPGVEVSASFGSVPIHVLGLFIRHREAWLRKFFAEAAARRIDRVRTIVAKLAREGVAVEAEAVFARSTHGTVGRPHVAELLVERGYVASLGEAFDRYLAEDRPAFVGYEKVTLEDAVELIHRAGGIASLAHPGLLDDTALVPRMADAGLPGLEVFHREHKPEQVSAFEELAANRGLFLTGGSDFHYHDGAVGPALGCPALTEDAFARLKAAAS
jgi:predicted metal-dependent phosphoesterase TrpH